jgi:lipopolysaccharide export system protein LptC
MAGDGSLHSRIVAALRVLLPLAALALLAALFLFGNQRNGIPAYDPGTVAALLRDPQMTAPTFAGVTEDGTDIRLSAERLRTDLAGGGAAIRPVLALTTPGGVRWRIEAGWARLEPAAQRVVLEGGVVISSSNGWRAETVALAAALDRSHVETAGAVSAEGPAGRITAGQMRLDRTGADEVLVFKGGVKLLYAPRS